MKKKTQYRIRNWPAYNAALIGRGSLTLWVDDAALRSWRYTGPTQRGAQYRYAAAAIPCVLDAAGRLPPGVAGRGRADAVGVCPAGGDPASPKLQHFVAPGRGGRRRFGRFAAVGPHALGD